MNRRIPITAATALMLGGCAVLGPKCSDCVPPKTAAVGYVSLQDRWITKQTAKSCAKRDFFNTYDKKCLPTKHFAEGFEQAYIDVALGKLPVVPAVPPSKYWNAYYRSCAGSNAVQDWFDGYTAGLDASRYHGVSQFNRIQSSWSNGTDNGCPTCGPNGT